MKTEKFIRRPKAEVSAPVGVWTVDDDRADEDRDEGAGDPLAELGLHPLPRKSHRVRIDPPGAPVGFI